MRLYTVHVKAEAPPDRRLVLVPEGFSFWAALLSLLWALWHRMLLVAFGFVLVDVAVMAGARIAGLPDITHSVLSVGLMILFGLIGQDLRRWTLGRKGYETRGIVSGADRIGAERRFLDHEPLVLTEVGA